MPLFYEDGTQIKVGDVVSEGTRTERYIVLGFVETHSARLLQIGTVIDDKSKQFGKTIVFPTGMTREVPIGVLYRLGYASITIEP